MIESKQPTAGPGPQVLAPAATGVTGLIEQWGGDPDSVLGRCRIPPDHIGNPMLSISLKSFCQLFEEAARQTHNDNFGVWFGNQFQPRNLGLWGYAAVASTTLGHALDNLVGLFRYHQQASVLRLAEAGGMLRLEYQIIDPSIVDRRQDAELSLGMFLNVCRECHGSAWVPEEVHFEHPKPLDWREHERAFSAPVYFGQPINALVFRTADLAARMPGADLKLLTIVQICLRMLGSEAEAPASLTDRIRIALRRMLPDGYPPIEDVAEEVAMAVPTLQRRLGQEGVTYKELVEQTRRDLALCHLRQRHLLLSEIAFLLGYSELSAFSRAFRRWTGESPRGYRERQTGDRRAQVAEGPSSGNDRCLTPHRS